jgi:hypothetical protein
MEFYFVKLRLRSVMTQIASPPFRGVPLGMNRVHPKCHDLSASDPSVAELILRQEPHQEEEEDDDDDDDPKKKDGDDDDDEAYDGYSE